ncbi:hypothetical protein DXG01_007920 [Tephrocybe rancida]|nr:hypothetical protein DXG01_007920 [Tephrocybe rancida]
MAPPVQPSVEPDALTAETLPNSDEIIIVEDVDTQDTFDDWLLPSLHSIPPFHRHTSPMKTLESSFPMTAPEILGLPHAFRSGVFTISSKEIDQHSRSTNLPPQPNSSPTLSDDTTFASPHVDATPSRIDERENFGSPVSFASGLYTNTTLHSTIAKPSLIYLDDDHEETSATTSHTLVSEAVGLQLPLSQSDKVRRIMHLDKGLITSVSMRGTVELFDVEPLRLRRSVSAKIQRTGELIDDACVVHAGDDYLMVFGHARDQEQLSWYRFRPGSTQAME